MTNKLKSDQDWKNCLTPEQYKILRKKGTERPFSGKFLKSKANGIYVCAACGNKLFSSQAKFESGSGWPSFYEVINQGKVKLQKEKNPFDQRLEVVCANCGGHLGHVFDDGPQPTGKRYCINSLSLDFKKNE